MQQKLKVVERRELFHLLIFSLALSLNTFLEVRLEMNDILIKRKNTHPSSKTVIELKLKVKIKHAF